MWRSILRSVATSAKRSARASEREQKRLDKIKREIYALENKISNLADNMEAKYGNGPEVNKKLEPKIMELGDKFYVKHNIKLSFSIKGDKNNEKNICKISIL